MARSRCRSGQATTSAAQWLAEGDSLADTGLTFNNITLKPRHVGAITELSRQLLQQSNPSIEQLVRDDFIQVVSLAVDKALLHGDGIKQPEGLLTAATGTGTLATLNWATVLTVLQGLALKNITPNAWLTHPKVATILRKTLREAGLPVSLTENLDAMEAVRHIPLDDRNAFKYALAATLVKNHSHWRAFETVFEVYFSLRGAEYSIGDDDGTGAEQELNDDLNGEMPEGAGKGDGSGGHGDGLTPEELAPHFPQLEILECIGRGGMGVVYKARQKTLNRLVALKLLAPEQKKDAAFAERFAHEARALAALNHPNIVTIYDVGRSEELAYIAMELLSGRSLRELLDSGAPMACERITEIVAAVADGLAYAHAQGIDVVHQ